MSNLPLNNIIEDFDDQFLSPVDSLDNSWSLYQEILQSTATLDRHILNNEEFNNNSISEDTSNSAAARVDRQHPATPQAAEKVLESGLELKKISIRTAKSKKRKKNSKINYENGAILEQDAEQGPSVAKKLDHNAKERIRRMKLNASFLALQALLPDSRRSKKRRCAPAIVDRVLKYIPELENEVQALRSKKENVQSAEKNKKIANEISSSQYQIPKVSFNKLNQEEAIIQICMTREDNQDGLAFSSLLQSLEDEGTSIKSASTLSICESIICCHLHIQIRETTSGADYFEQLRDKMISWLK